MKNNLFNKKPKTAWIALLVLFFGLFANEAVGQITYTWNGSTSTSWTDPINWTPSAGTSYPGTVATDIVVIDKNDTPFAPIFTGTATIGKLTISNAFGTLAGATLTIASGTLNVISTAIDPITLAGGSIVNNGTLNATTTNTGVAFGITLGTPTQAPSSGSYNYGYTGGVSSTLTINTGSGNASSGAFQIASNNAFSKYNLVLNGTITFNLNNSQNTYAIRSAALAISPLSIGGAGFSTTRGLLQIASGVNMTVESGTTLTTVINSTVSPHGIQSSNGSATSPSYFTNKGTINISGTTLQSGIQLFTFTTGPATINFENQGTINVDLICTAASKGAFNVIVSTATGTINVTNTSTGLMNLRNSQPNATNFGSAIFIATGGFVPDINFINNGELNLTGNNANAGGQSRSIITNNGTINSNHTFANFTINNNATGIFNFKKTGASFTVLIGAAATAGAIYTDTNSNSYTITTTKVSGTGTTLLGLVAVNQITTLPATGTLTKTSGTGDATIAYTVVAQTGPVNAITALGTNAGTINTDSGTTLNVLSQLTMTSTSVIAPGGTSGKGFVNFSRAASTTLSGKFNIQVSGNTSAGVDYDQILNTIAIGSFTLTGATLDVTGIYTPGGTTTIDIVTASTVAASQGTITGTFDSVIGLTPGWTVNYIPGTAGSVTGKVQLVYSTANTWTGATSIDWTDATNWSAGVPNQNSDVTIVTTANQPVIASNVNINSLTITSGVLTVNSGFNLTVTGAVANNGGTMTLANNANLIQGGTSNSNTGNITVNRNSNALSRLDYNLWSSPVTGSQTLLGFSPLTSIAPDIRFYIYNETSNLYSDAVPGNPFATATGYLIRMPNDAATAPATQTFAGIFTGVPNNGNISKAVTYNGTAPFGYNAIGNPYPSTIDAQAFIAANTANIESSLYFWRKINAAAGSAYAVYNPMGSTIATPSSAVPNGTIQVGQGFFVKAKSATNVNFTNAMRVASNANQFFKTKAAQKDRVWLNLSRPASKIGTKDILEAFSQALIGYTSDATSGVDMYDAKYINDSKTALTSSINDEEYTIQGRPAFDATDVVGLNFKNDTAGDYTIALDQFDGVFTTGQDIYLLDSKTGIETDLKMGSYTFAAVAGTDNARFSLKYQKTLKVNAPAFNENSVSVYKNNGTLYVNASSVNINTIEVYDVQGRLLASQRNVKATTASINNLRASKQVLIVKIAGVDNSVVTKKVVN